MKKQILLSFFFAATAFGQSFFLQPERPVAAPRIGVPSVLKQRPVIATDGTNRLLVWSDDRATLPAHSKPAVQAIYAARVDAAGNVLDSPNLVLPLQGKVIPFWNGREFVVVSQDNYVRISAQGELLDPTPLPFSAPAGSLESLAWNGERLFIVSLVTQPYDKVYGTVYDSSMNVTLADRLLVNGAHYGPHRIAANSSGFLLAGDREYESVIAFDREGKEIAQHTFTQVHFRSRPLVATDGTNYLLVGLGAGFTGDAFFAINVTSTGEFLNLRGPFGDPLYFHAPCDLVWDGDVYRFVYLTERPEAPFVSATRDKAVAVTLDRNGNSPDFGGATLLPETSSIGFPEIVAGARTTGTRLMFWSEGFVPAGGDYRDIEYRWKGVAYDADASFSTTSHPVDYSRGALPEETAVVATAGDVSLLVWREPDETADGSFALLAARVDRFGRVLDAPPIRVANVTCDRIGPAVSTDGTDFLVAWQEQFAIQARRVARDGRLLDPAAIILQVPTATGGCGTASVGAAWNGTNYLVAGTDGNIVYGARVTRGGTVLDPQSLTLSGNDPVADLHVASNGRDYFVAWTDTRRKEAFGNRVSGDGNVLDAGGFGLSIETATAMYWSGRNYVTLSGGGDTVHASRVTSDGQRIDFSFGAPPPPAIQLPLDAPVQCDARGCFTYAWKNGMIVATRIDDSPAGVTAESTPFARADDSMRSLLVFGDTLKNVVYLRRPAESPYAGAWHLFIRSTAQARGRAIIK